MHRLRVHHCAFFRAQVSSSLLYGPQSSDPNAQSSAYIMGSRLTMIAMRDCVKSRPAHANLVPERQSFPGEADTDSPHNHVCASISFSKEWIDAILNCRDHIIGSFDEMGRFAAAQVL